MKNNNRIEETTSARPQVLPKKKKERHYICILKKILTVFKAVYPTDHLPLRLSPFLIPPRQSALVTDKSWKHHEITKSQATLIWNMTIIFG